MLEETRQKLEESGVSLELLPIWYDVDRPDDLRFLKTHLELLAAAGSEGRGFDSKVFEQAVTLTHIKDLNSVNENY